MALLFVFVIFVGGLARHAACIRAGNRRATCIAKGFPARPGRHSRQASALGGLPHLPWCAGCPKFRGSSSASQNWPIHSIHGKRQVPESLDRDLPCYAMLYTIWPFMFRKLADLHHGSVEDEFSKVSAEFGDIRHLTVIITVTLPVLYLMPVDLMRANYTML